MFVEFKHQHADVPELKSEPGYDVIINGLFWFSIYDPSGNQQSEILAKLQAIIDEYSI